MSFYERNYPGTVQCIAWWVCHFASERCPRDDPHGMDECGEFDPPRFDPDPPQQGPSPRRSFMNYETMRPWYWEQHDSA
jgi:hypothetical protein